MFNFKNSRAVNLQLLYSVDMQQSPILPLDPDDPNRQTPVVSRPKNEETKSIVGSILIFICAPLIAWIFTLIVFQTYEVDGPSMETTLQHQDRLVVWKLPKTMAKITGNPYVPKRGEIIIFTKRGSSEVAEYGNRQLIKRVIGVPGDRVVVHDGVITVYNEEYPKGFNPDLGHDYSAGISDFTGGNVDLYVGENEVFVAGDNRENSLDSRAFGTVPSEDIVGSLSFRIYPVSKLQSFL